MKFVVAVVSALAVASAVKVSSDPIYSSAGLIKKDPEDHSNEFFRADQHEGIVNGKTYNRVLPAHFNGEGEFDDRFMHSMLTKWAIERKTKDGSPSGKFYMDRLGAQSVAREVLMNNLGMTSEKADAHLKEYFERSWLHFDVNHENVLEIGLMPMFMRFLGGTGYINGLHAQVKTAAKH